jgi:hypothetical protein
MYFKGTLSMNIPWRKEKEKMEIAYACVEHLQRCSVCDPAQKNG